jgi:hypothetical protein
MNRIGDFLVYGIVVAGILVLTRPGSQGPKLVTALTSGLTGFAQGVSGQTVTK